jgi:NAD(P)-dependent dehydrogenase (short-subunit alcohol dehydrogenase family)
LRTAEIFVAEGAKIVIAGRRVPEGEALARKLGPACVFRRTDVIIEDDMRGLIGEAVDRFGRIDCLFNNAGGPAQTGGIEGLDVARFDAAIPRYFLPATNPLSSTGMIWWLMAPLPVVAIGPHSSRVMSPCARRSTRSGVEKQNAL